MGLFLVDDYEPKMSLPMYSVITFPKRQDWEVGDTYEIKVEDGDRAEERVDDKPFNPTHEAILIGQEEMKLRSVPPVVLAFDANTSVKGKAIERISSGGGKYSEDRDVVVLSFVRKDAAISFVQEEYEGIGDKFTKSDTESN